MLFSMLFSLAAWRFDLPVEVFNVPVERLADVVLQDTQGVLSLNTDLQALREKRTNLLLYDRPQTDASKRPLPLAETQPLSGWEYDGVACLRFPIVQRGPDDFLLVVLDPVKDRRAWVRFGELPWHRHYRMSDDNDKDFLADHTHWFDDFRVEGDEALGLPVDVWALSRDGKIHLLSRDRHEAKGMTVGRTDIVDEGGPNDLYGDQYYYIVEIRNGFARLEISPRGATPMNNPWIPLRDDKGRLQVWVAFIPGC